MKICATWALVCNHEIVLQLLKCTVLSVKHLPILGLAFQAEWSQLVRKRCLVAQGTSFCNFIQSCSTDSNSAVTKSINVAGKFFKSRDSTDFEFRWNSTNFRWNVKFWSKIFSKLFSLGLKINRDQLVFGKKNFQEIGGRRRRKHQNETKIFETKLNFFSSSAVLQIFLIGGPYCNSIIVLY